MINVTVSVVEETLFTKTHMTCKGFGTTENGEEM
jgi:hypothetical protein